MGTTIENIFAALRSELRKPRHLQSKHFLRKWRKDILFLGKRQKSFLEYPEGEFCENVVRREEGKSTVKCMRYSGFYHEEVRS